MDRFKEHADVLKMAKSKEKREAIKWFYARRVFFIVKNLPLGLELARESEHPDARYFASLFPGAAPQTNAGAVEVFVAQRDEPRALCWASVCLALDPDIRCHEELLRRSAQGGDAWGQVILSRYDDNAPVELLENALAQGEPEALHLQACRLFAQIERNAAHEAAAAKFFREGAELGNVDCQYEYGMLCSSRDSLAQFEWLRRAAMQNHFDSICHFVMEAVRFVALYDGGGSGRIVYEIGAASAGSNNTWPGMDEKQRAANERAVSLYKLWNEEAKRAVLCWLWLAREKNVVKDIRRLIADLIWEERAAWSERRVIGGVNLEGSARNKKPRV